MESQDTHTIDANPQRLAIIEEIERRSPGMYDLSSCDERGSPTLLDGGSSPSKQQKRNIEKALLAATKAVAKAGAAQPLPTKMEDVAKQPRSCPNPGCGEKFASEKQLRNHQCGCLPEGYWEAQSPAATEARATSGAALRLGIDVGGVIAVSEERRGNGGHCYPAAAAAQPGEDTVLTTGAVVSEECFVAVTKLVNHFGAEHVFIVSKAGERMAASTRTWLAEQGFHQRTGLREEHVFFCKDRPQKRPIVDALGITHFIDDRWSVLKHLDECQCRFLFPQDRDNNVPKKVMESGTLFKVEGWAGVLHRMRLPPAL